MKLVIGHFQAASTFSRIREKYFWSKMMDYIIECVQQCIVCQRHQKIKPKSHKALSTVITGLFDQIGIDCVFGLPVTDEGFCGIVVITEYLSKIVFVEAIKSKEANEIVRVLWRYISISGPPKIVLSDQGREFVNNLVDTLLKSVGSEHRIT